MDPWWDGPAFVGIAVAIPSFILGWLGYRRSRKVDAVTKEVSAHETVVTGLSQLVARLQEDNALLRQEVHNLRGRIFNLENNIRGATIPDV